MSSRRTRRHLRRPRYSDDAPYGEEPAENEEVEEEVVEENSVTRCVCGTDELDIPDNAGSDFDDVVPGFFIQCEQCSAWQHGYCVGIKGDGAAPEKYWCEQCRPEMHYLFVDKYGVQRSRYDPTGGKKRKGRRKSEPKKEAGGAGGRRKSRTTMNSSRDYAYDEMLKKVLEESAREANKDEDGKEDEKEGEEEGEEEEENKEEENKEDVEEEEEEVAKEDANKNSSSVKEEKSDAAEKSDGTVKSDPPKADSPTFSKPQSRLSITAPIAQPEVSASESAGETSSASTRRGRRKRSRESGSETPTTQPVRRKTRRPRQPRHPKEPSGRFGDDKPFRANIPSTRISMNEMRRRIFSIMEFISNIQMELSNEEDTKNSLLRMQQEDTTGELRSPENLELQKGLIACYNDSVVKLDILTKRLNGWEERYAE